MPYYTFVDVETPNRHNDRICSIGIVVSDEVGNVLERKSQLVNPETTFDDINMRNCDMPCGRQVDALVP